MKIFYQISTFNNDGLIKEYKKRQCKSFIKQFIQFLYGIYANITYTSAIKAISGTTYTYSGDQSWYYGSITINGRGNTAYSCNYQSANLTYNSSNVGIVVGTGTTAVAIDQYKLITRITDGTGSGELRHSAMGWTGVELGSGNSASFDCYRIFKNGSGGTVTINELGIYSVERNCTVNTEDEFCIIRDKLASPITVTDGTYVQITYTFQVTA